MTLNAASSCRTHNQNLTCASNIFLLNSSANSLVCFTFLGSLILSSQPNVLSFDFMAAPKSSIEAGELTVPLIAWKGLKPSTVLCASHLNSRPFRLSFVAFSRAASERLREKGRVKIISRRTFF